MIHIKYTNFFCSETHIKTYFRIFLPFVKFSKNAINKGDFDIEWKRIKLDYLKLFFQPFHSISNFKFTLIFSTPDNPIIQTKTGKVKGQLIESIYGDKYYYFDGIPYGQPPVGEYRFKPPRPVLKWPGIVDCTISPNKSLQWNWRLKEVQGSEDCLYLNVNVKKLDAHPKLPVMVYIHGGGFNGGDPTRRAWAPDYFMMKDVILITVGYRLGAMGKIDF